MILEDMEDGDIPKTETKFILQLLSKHGIVSFFYEKGFELSVTFAAVLQSNMEKYSPLKGVLFAVKSYAEEATDAERAVMCTHILFNVLSEKQRSGLIEDMMPLFNMIKKTDADFESGYLSKLIEKIKSSD